MRLIYYPDSRPGITRKRQGRGFSYLAADGTRIDDRAERQRLAAMAVPPAYENVWMTPHANGHLFATGRDARGRKQYRYHPDWQAAREVTKFDALTHVAEALPTLRRWIADRLQGEVGTRETTIAAALALIDRAALRPGHPAYTLANGSFGALTLRRRHLRVQGDVARLTFVAKGGIRVKTELRGRRIARVLHASAELPGADLFRHEGPDGEMVPLRAEHLNETLQALCGDDMTCKSLRTWAGTHAAFLVAYDAPEDVPPTITALAEAASLRLHNTPAIARKSYVHPEVIALAGQDESHRRRRAARLSDAGPGELRRGEAALRRFLAG